MELELSVRRKRIGSEKVSLDYVSGDALRAALKLEWRTNVSEIHSYLSVKANNHYRKLISGTKN